MDKESNVSMEGIVEPKYNKRRKGYTFSVDGMEIFIKGEDKDKAIEKLSAMLSSSSADKSDETTRAFAEGGMEDGGLKQEGGSVDPVSGNEVPVGSTEEEVRDDIPAQLSEGEFVFPADVVRYIGLENLMELRQKAKMGLQRMDAMGQMGNADEATMDDDEPYDDEVDKTIEAMEPGGGSVLAIGIGPAPEEMAQGGMPRGNVPTVEQEMMMQRKNPMRMARGGAVPTVEQEMMGMQVGGYVPPPSPMMGMPMQQQNVAMPLTAMSPQQQRDPNVQNMQARTYAQGGAVNMQVGGMGSRQQRAQYGLGLNQQRAATYTPQYSQRQYYNPETNEIRVISFINGQPAPPGVPAGFQPYDPATAVQEKTEEQTKELAVQQVGGDGSEDREREAQRNAEYQEFQNTISALSELDPEFADKYAATGSLSKAQLDIATGKADPSLRQTVEDLIKGGGVVGGAISGVKGDQVVGDSLRGLADQYGIDVDPFETFGFLTDKTGLLNEIRSKAEPAPVSDFLSEAREEVESLTASERDRGRETYESLKDRGISVADSGLTGRELTAAQEAAFDEIRAEARRNRNDDDDDRGGSDLTGTDDLGGSGGFEGSRGVDEDRGPGGERSGGSDMGAGESPTGDDTDGSPFSKGGAVKSKQKKGLGRLK